MGFLSNIFGRNRNTLNLAYLSDSFHRELLLSAIKTLRSSGWSKVSESEFPVLEDDRGFFDDLMRITLENEMFLQLRDDNKVLFRNTAASIFLLAGIYVVFCARIFQKPLYTNYAEVMRRFKQCGPLECVMNFLRPAQGPHYRVSFDEVTEGILAGVDRMGAQKLERLDDDMTLTTFCKSFYQAGNAIGFYYI